MSKRIPILIGLCLLTIAVWFTLTPNSFIRELTNRLDNVAFDLRDRINLLAKNSEVASPIVIVDIDNRSLKEYGRWPWSRSTLALLMDQLHAQGAAVVALDMSFPESELNIAQAMTDKLKGNPLYQSIIPTLQKLIPNFDNDTIFATSLKQMNSVIGVTFERNDTLLVGVPPQPLMEISVPTTYKFIYNTGIIGNIAPIHAAATAEGFLNIFADPDGIIRRAPLLLRYKRAIYPSLALQAVRLYLLINQIELITANHNGQDQLEGIKLGHLTIPTDVASRVFIPFHGANRSFSYYSAIDVINKKIPADALQGKLVFVGASANGSGDLQSSVAQAAFPGVQVQATLADAIMSGKFPNKPPWATGAELFSTLIIGLLAIFLFPRLGPLSLTLAAIVIPSILMFININISAKTGLILSFLVPTLLVIALAIMNMAYGYVFEMRRRERLRGMFGQYVPEEHIEEMLKTRGDYALEGDEREMSVLFADIRNFTSISEKMPAAAVKKMLDQFFTPMTQIIFDHKGTVDKYVGDMMMAFWGAPLPDANHANHALSAALDMQTMGEQLKTKFIELGLPTIEIGIGINTGIMIVGDMGSKFRRNYTVLGDAVNLASRLESLSRVYEVKSIVSGDTCKNQTDFIFRQLDKVLVKGKALPVEIYEIVCRANEGTDALRKEIELSDRALGFYYSRAWDKAMTLFEQLHTAYPEKLLYRIYIDRITQFRHHPPPTDWAGVYQYQNK